MNRRKHITIAYSGPSCKTGRALFDALSEDPRVRVTRVRKRKRVRKTDLFVRWGNSHSWNPEGVPMLNSREAVNNASDKGAMMRKLVACPEVKTPNVSFTWSREPLKYSHKMFIRGANNVIRFDDTYRPSDKYVALPIENKRREYRVHVFKGKVVAIYEKCPNEDGVRLFKSHNCHFSKKDPAICRLTKDGQDMAVKAVECLGMDFGGVDMALTWNEKEQRVEFVVIEVNSAMGLNGPNVERWKDLIVNEVTEGETK